MFTEKKRQALFPITRQWIYLNHAAVGPFPQHVQEAALHYLAGMATLGQLHWEKTGLMMADLRRKLGEMLGVTGDEIAFTRNVSEGISFLASGFPWQDGDNVVIPEHEFPANVYPWLSLERRGVKTRFVPLSQGVFGVEDLARVVDDRTRIVSMSSVQFFNGFRPDLQAIGAFCRSKRIVFCVDVIQQFGAFPVDMRSASIDFLAGGGHKWLLSGEGIGFVACRASLAERLFPGNVGWQGVKQWEDFFDLRLDYKPGALKLETGTVSAFGLHCLNASIDFLRATGMERIGARVTENAETLISLVKREEWSLETPATGRRSGIITFAVPGLDAKVLVERLKDQGVQIAARQGKVRVSPHFYNTSAELENLVKIIKTLVKRPVH